MSASWPIAKNDDSGVYSMGLEPRDPNRWWEANQEMTTKIFKDTLIKGVRSLNKTSKMLELPFEFKIELPISGKQSQFYFTSNAFRRIALDKIIKDQAPLFVDDDTAENIMGIVKEYRKSKWLEQGKTHTFNCGKKEQAGKTWDMYLLSVLTPALVSCEFNSFVMPLILLPSETDLEEQTRQEFSLLTCFTDVISVKHKNQEVSLRNVVHRITEHYQNGVHVIRRAGGKKSQTRVLEVLEDAFSKKHSVIIMNDEADKGCGKGSVMDKIYSTPVLGKCLYERAKTNDNNFAFFNFSATLFPYTPLADNAKTITLKPSKSYVHWLEIDTMDHSEFATRSGVDKWDLLAETCSSTHHPLGAVAPENIMCCKKTFLFNNMVKQINFCDGEEDVSFRLRKPLEPRQSFTKREVEHFMATYDNETLGDHLRKWTNQVPITIDKTVRNVLFPHDTQHDSFKDKKGMVLRFILKNDITAELVERIRKLAKKDYLVLLMTSGEAKTDTITFLRNAYRQEGIPLYSKPFILFVTNKMRRGSRLCDDIIQVEFTKSPTTITSMSQANGRSSNKTNSSLVVSSKHYEDILEWKNGTSTKKRSSYVQNLNQNGIGRPCKTVEVSLETIQKNLRPENAFMLPIFEEINTRILSYEHYLENIRKNESKVKTGGTRRGLGLVGGERLMESKNGRKVPKVPSLFSIVTPDVIRKIERNHKFIFLTTDGTKEVPMFEKVHMLTFDPDKNKNNQPEGMLATTAGKNGTAKDQREQYDGEMVNGRMYFYHGYRWDALSTNTGARKDASRQQVQIKFKYNEQKDRLECVELHFRLAAKAEVNLNLVPKEGSVPAQQASQREQDKWYGKKKEEGMYPALMQQLTDIYADGSPYTSKEVVEKLKSVFHWTEDDLKKTDAHGDNECKKSIRRCQFVLNKEGKIRQVSRGVWKLREDM